MIFLDANAGLPVLPVAKEALVRALDVVGNPSSTHALGRSARSLLDEARDHVARALGAEARELTFMSGASEANRWLVDAVARLDKVVASSPFEHPSLAKPLAKLPARIAQIHLDVAGENVGLENVGAADVLFVTAAHNETGIIPRLDWLLARAKPECIVCVDAAQAMARLDVLPKRVDAIVASAHKIGGAAGSGALVLRGNAANLRAGWLGGGQEAGLRPGTEALALHVAFGAAASVIEETRAKHAALAPLRDRLEQELSASWQARRLGANEPRLPNTFALVVEGCDGDALRIAIDGAGVAVGFGSACSAMAPEPSLALKALGLRDDDARATVRFSLAPTTTANDIDQAIERLRPLRSLIDRSRQRRSKVS